MGARNGLGVFILPMSDEFGWERGTISIALAVGWVTGGITQPVIGSIYDRYGGRNVVSTSMLIIGSAALLLSLTTNIWFLIGVYGILMSIASGGSSLVTVSAVISKWFYRKRGLALSIGTSGGSAGSLILTPFTAYLIILIDWRMTWAVLGLMVLVIGFPVAFLFVRNRPSNIDQNSNGNSPNVTVGDQEMRTVSDTNGPLVMQRWIQSYRSAPIWQLSVAYFVCGMTTAIISVHYVPFAIERGFTLKTAAMAFGLMSGLNVVGVLGIGSIADRFQRRYLLGLVYGVRGLAYATLIFTPTEFGIWAFAVIAGLSWIASAPLTSSLTADIYGLDTLGTLGGMTSFAHQVGGALSVVMGGVLYDIFGTYDVPFAICGSTLAFASVVSFTIQEKQYSIRYLQRKIVASG